MTDQRETAFGSAPRIEQAVEAPRLDHLDDVAALDLTIEELEERIQLAKKAEGGSGSCGSSSSCSPTWKN